MNNLKARKKNLKTLNKHKMKSIHQLNHEKTEQFYRHKKYIYDIARNELPFLQ